MNGELPKKELLRVDEVAEYFGVHHRTIRLWIDHGHLQATKMAGTIRVFRQSVDSFKLRGIERVGDKFI